MSGVVKAFLPWPLRIGLAMFSHGKDFAAGVWDWITRSPVRLCLILSLAMAAVAFGEHRAAAKWQQQAGKAITTLTNERAAAQIAQAKAEANYRSIANAADTSYRAGLAQGDTRLAAYIASHRVRIEAPAHPSGAAKGSGARVPENPAADSVVAALTISEADLKICDQNYAYAFAAHQWATALNKGN